MKLTRVLVTGGAGFIGSHFVDLMISQGVQVIVLDLLTYAGRRENLESAIRSGKCELVVGNICDSALVSRLLEQHSIGAIVHFAAESHVDRSITGPGSFIDTNVVGTFRLLEASLNYYRTLQGSLKESFRFIQVSTDEVFGMLGPDDQPFSETTPYAPSSPYSASKASSDHLARAWHHTYGLPVIVTNCSNNYGPRQFPEKLIPHMIACAVSGKPLPVYGKGENIRDWIQVQDHCRGVMLALTQGKVGESYCFGGRSERKNIDLVKTLCRLLDEMQPRKDGKSYESQISFVTDRLGHDFRYAINDSKAEQELGFKRAHSFETGLRATVEWYLKNEMRLKES